MDDPSLSSTCCPSVMLLVGTGTFPPPSAEHGRGGGWDGQCCHEGTPTVYDERTDRVCMQEVRSGRKGRALSCWNMIDVGG